MEEGLCFPSQIQHYTRDKLPVSFNDMFPRMVGEAKQVANPSTSVRVSEEASAVF